MQLQKALKSSGRQAPKPKQGLLPKKGPKGSVGGPQKELGVPKDVTKKPAKGGLKKRCTTKRASTLAKVQQDCRFILGSRCKVLLFLHGNRFLQEEALGVRQNGFFHSPRYWDQIRRPLCVWQETLANCSTKLPPSSPMVPRAVAEAA